MCLSHGRSLLSFCTYVHTILMYIFKVVSLYSSVACLCHSQCHSLMRATHWEDLQLGLGLGLGLGSRFRVHLRIIAFVHKGTKGSFQAVVMTQLAFKIRLLLLQVVQPPVDLHKSVRECGQVSRAHILACMLIHHSLVLSLNLICSFHALTCSFSHLFTCSCIRLFICLFIHFEVHHAIPTTYT